MDPNTNIASVLEQYSQPTDVISELKLRAAECLGNEAAAATMVSLASVSGVMIDEEQKRWSEIMFRHYRVDTNHELAGLILDLVERLKTPPDGCLEAAESILPQPGDLWSDWPERHSLFDSAREDMLSIWGTYRRVTAGWLNYLSSVDDELMQSKFRETFDQQFRGRNDALVGAGKASSAVLRMETWDIPGGSRNDLLKIMGDARSCVDRTNEHLRRRHHISGREFIRMLVARRIIDRVEQVLAFADRSLHKWVVNDRLARFWREVGENMPSSGLRPISP